MASGSNPAKHRGYLNKIYVENINVFQNFEWELNPSFNVLHEESFIGSVKPVRILIDLIGSICKGKMEKGKFLGNVKDDDRPAAIILKETSEETVFHGVFSWQGEAWYFKKCKESLQYQRLGEGKIHERKLDEKESNWEDNTDKMILCLAEHTRSSSIEKSEFSIETCTTFIIEGDCPEISGTRKRSPYGPVEIKNGKADSRFYGQTTANLVDLHGKKDVCKTLEKIKKAAADQSVQVLAITDDYSIRTKCQDYNLFVAKCLYDGKSNGFNVVLFKIMGMDYASKYENILKNGGIIFFVEGPEDKKIIQALITLFRNELQDLNLTTAKREALHNMLGAIYCQELEGKGNAKAVKKYIGLPIPHVTVLDQDAIFYECSAKQIQLLPTCKKSERSEKDLAVMLPKEVVGKVFTPTGPEGRSAPAVELVDEVYFFTCCKPSPVKYNYIKLAEDDSLKEHAVDVKHVFSSYIRRRMESKEGLSLGQYIKMLRTMGNIYVWIKGDGTSSGALKLDKKTVLKGKYCLPKELEKRRHGGEINSFGHFLFDHVFKLYNNFYFRMSQQENGSLERQFYRKDVCTEIGVITVSLLPDCQVTVPDEDLLEIMEQHLKNMAEEISSKIKEAGVADEEETKNPDVPDPCITAPSSDSAMVEVTDESGERRD